MKAVQIFLIIATFTFGKTFGLECHQCIYFDGVRNKNILQASSGKLKKQCAYPMMNDVPKTTCSSGMQCGAASGKVSLSSHEGPDIFDVIIFDCMPASGNVCEKPNSNQKYTLTKILDSVTGYSSINLDWLTVCTCNDDLCDAICGNSYRFHSFCLQPGLLIFLGIVSILMSLLLVSCCCCCCCCCCCTCFRRKPSTRGVVVNAPQPLVMNSAINMPNNMQCSVFVPPATERPAEVRTTEHLQPPEYHKID